MKRASLGLLMLCLLAVAGLAQAAWQAAGPPSSFAADFVQTRSLPGFDQPLTSHGRLSWSRQAGFRWEITRPYHYVFAMREGTAHELLPDGSSRTLAADKTPWLASVQHIFVSALSGDQSQLARYFSISRTPLAAGKGRRLELRPLSDALGTAIVRIEVVEDAPGQPRELTIFEASGGRMQMRFTPVPTPGQGR